STVTVSWVAIGSAGTETELLAARNISTPQELLEYEYFYSAVNNAFYPLALYPNYIACGTWPDDATPVDNSVYLEYAVSNPPQGKIRIAGSDGLPSWVGISPPAENEVAGRTLVKNTALRAQYAATAALNIATLQAGIDSNRSADGDSDALAAWQGYLCDLREMPPEDLQQSPALFPTAPASIF
ncbi:tail fiber assembly protein, partial [Citrobacter freundii]|nr:tail fiber assembly protein [Citrobacter freundii]